MLRLSLIVLLFLVNTKILAQIQNEQLPMLNNPTEEQNQYNITHQYGANQGVYALGFGYRFEKFEPSISFGYSPPFQSSQAVTQLNFKFNWELWNYLGSPSLQWLMGFSLLMNNSPSTYFDLPKPYPNKYYPPNAYFLGFQSTLRHHNFYIEVSVIDYYLEVIARNSIGTMRSGDLVSVGFGYLQDVDFRWSKVSTWIRNLF